MRLIDESGENIGVVSLKDALSRAENAGLDLVEISGNVSPPVCKILDYGRFKYQERKRQAQARSKQKTSDLNEVKIRPNIEKHDYEVKIRTIERILERGDRARLVVRFRGREIMRQDLGAEILRKIVEDMSETVRIEQLPRKEGRQLVMVLAKRMGGSKANPEEINPAHFRDAPIVPLQAEPYTPTSEILHEESIAAPPPPPDTEGTDGDGLEEKPEPTETVRSSEL